MPSPARPVAGKPREARRAGGTATQQAQKSAQTRLQLIEAAISCIIKYGYADTISRRVAAEAGLSRGAMMHHFDNGPALIRAAIAHLNEKRLRAFQRTVNIVAGQEDARALLAAYWKQVTSPTFLALHELAIAARTDKDLAAILFPAERAFAVQWYRLAEDLFPAWQNDRRKFRLALTLCQHTLEGMAINRLIYGADDQMVEQILVYLEEQIRALHPSPQAAAAEASTPEPAAPAGR